jgi:hypothetical protein
LSITTSNTDGEWELGISFHLINKTLCIARLSIKEYLAAVLNNHHFGYSALVITLLSSTPTYAALYKYVADTAEPNLTITYSNSNSPNFNGYNTSAAACNFVYPITNSTFVQEDTVHITGTDNFRVGHCHFFSVYNNSWYDYIVVSRRFQNCPTPIHFPNMPYTFSHSSGKCERMIPYIKDLAISLSGPTTTEPRQGQAFTATVTSTDGTPITEPVTVEISLKVEEKSGGHDHGDNTRPRGSIAGKECQTDETCQTLSTDASGVLNFDFMPPEAAGTHTITVKCDRCSNGPQMAEIKVKVSGLTKIHSAPALYTLIGAVEGRHTDNHYLTAESLDNIFGLAADYHLDRRFWQPSKTNPKKLVPPQPLGFNDASLVWGGKFDLSGKWSGNHYEHHKGAVIDIRANNEAGAVPEVLFGYFVKMSLRAGAAAVLECTSNKVDGMGRNPENGCIGKDNSFDNNRHYHLRILGR